MTEVDSSMLLRAEIRSDRETVVSYARDLTRTSVFVVTDWHPALGTEVRLRISLATLVEPFEIRARVSGYKASIGVGAPAGLTFDFTLDSPASRDAVERALTRLSPLAGAAVRDYRVLLVEDNAFIRDMFAYGIAKYFANRSVAFEHAGDAASAWEKLDVGPFDLVIVDYYLPAQDGATFIARLRADPRFARAPIVAISVGGRDAREATIEAGADLFLDKPVVLRDLFRTLQVLSTRGAIA